MRRSSLATASSRSPVAPSPGQCLDLGLLEEVAVDLSPGQRKKYLGHLKVLATTEVRGSLVFTRPVTEIGEADLKEWLIGWDRSLKTKSNYHGLMHGVFAYAAKQGWVETNPAVGTAPKMSRVKQSRPELRFLTETELARAVELALSYGDLLSVAAATGLRFGEITALWVIDVDPAHPLTFDDSVNGGAADTEEFGDLGGAVLAAVHQGNEVSFLAPVELGLLAAQPTLGLGHHMPSRCGAGSGRTRLCGQSWSVKPHNRTDRAISDGGAVAGRCPSEHDPALRAECRRARGGIGAPGAALSCLESVAAEPLDHTRPHLDVVRSGADISARAVGR
jgi:hypothetical protein